MKKTFSIALFTLLLSYIALGQNDLESRFLDLQKSYRQGDHARVLENMDALIADFDLYTGKSPNYYTCWVLKGLSALASGDQALAEKSFTTVIQDTSAGASNLYPSHVKLGQLYHQQSKWLPAATSYETAVRSGRRLKKSEAELIQLQFNAGLLYFQAEDYERATALLNPEVFSSATLEEVPLTLRSEASTALYHMAMQSERWTQAQEHAETAFELGTTHRHAEIMLAAFKRLCKVQLYIESAPSLTPAYETLGTVGDYGVRAEALFNLGVYYKLSGQNRQALTNFETLTGEWELRRRLSEENALQAFQFYGDALRNRGFFQDAEKAYLKAKQFAQRYELQDTPLYGKLANSLGLLYDDLGRYPEAEAALREDLAIIQSTEGQKSLAYAQTTSNLGLVQLHQGNFNEAEKSLKLGLSIRRQQLPQQHPKLAESYNNLGFLNMQRGSLDKAERYYSLALQLLDEGQRKDRAATLVSLGSIYDKKEALSEAEDYYREALALLENTDPAYGAALNNLALTLHHQGKPKEALAAHKQYMQLVGERFGDQHPQYATGLFNLGYLEEKTENYTEALESYQKALSIRQKRLGKDHPVYSQTLHALTRVLIQQKQYKLADANLQQLSKSYRVQLENYFPYLSERERSAYFQELEDELLQFHNYVLLRGSDNIRLIAQAYEIQLLTKGLLLASRRQMRTSILASKDSSLTSLYEKWASLRERYAHEGFELSADENEALRLEIESLEKELTVRSSDFKKSRKRHQLAWKQLAEGLDDQSALVEFVRVPTYDFSRGGTYIEGEVSYLAYITTAASKGAPVLEVLPHGPHMEGKQFTYYRNSIQYKLQDTLSYGFYWKPLEKHLHSTIQRLFVVPDYVYNRINLNTLYLPQEDAYLIDRFQIMNIVSAKSLQQWNSKSTQGPQRWSSALIGNPNFARHPRINDIKALPGAEKEIQKISQLLENADQTYQVATQDSATESKLKTIQSPKTIHIATHGYFLEDTPPEKQKKGDPYAAKDPLLRSGLILSADSTRMQGQNDDGILTAYEAMNLNLEETELVVLSACNTGVASKISGEGVYGLQRAFVEAGAQSVVMSLWEVEDQATAEHMMLFYKLLFDSGDRYAAFRQSQIEIRKQYPHPKYWGAFVMVLK